MVPTTAYVVARCEMGVLRQFSPSRFVATTFEDDVATDEKWMDLKLEDAIDDWKRWLSEKGMARDFQYIPMVQQRLGIEPTRENTLRILPTGELTNSEAEDTKEEPRHADGGVKEGEEKMDEKKDFKQGENDKCYTLMATSEERIVPAAVFMKRKDAEDFKRTLESLAANGILGAKADYEIFETLLRD